MMSRFQTTICTTLALAMLASAMPTQVMADDDEWYNGEEAWFGYGLIGGAILGSVITNEVNRGRHHGGYYEHRYDSRRFIRGGYCAPTYVYREPVYYYEPAPVYYVAPQPVVYVPAAQPVVVQQQPTVIQQQAPTVYQQAPQTQTQPVPQQAPGTEINYAPQTRVEAPAQTQVSQSTPTYEKYSEDRVWPFWRKTRQESFPVLTNNNPGRSEAVSGGLRSTNARQTANQQPIVVNNYYYTVPAGSTTDPNAANDTTTSTAPGATAPGATTATAEQSAPTGYWTPAPATTTVSVPVRNQSGSTNEKVREYFPATARPEPAPAETAATPEAQPATLPAAVPEVSEEDVRDEVTRLRQRLAELESMLPEEAQAPAATPAATK